jgi:hypothetical protein
MGALAGQYPDYVIKGAILTIDLAHGEVAFFNGYEPQQMIFAGSWNVPMLSGPAIRPFFAMK